MSKLGFNKIQRFFKDYRLKEEKELFDYAAAIGFGYVELKYLLYYFAHKNSLSFSASTTTIRNYIQLEGLWERRQTSLRIRPRREYKRKKNWSMKDYVRVR